MPDPTSFPGLLVAAPETRTMPVLHCLSLGDVSQDFWGWVGKLELPPRHLAAGA